MKIHDLTNRSLTENDKIARRVQDVIRSLGDKRGEYEVRVAPNNEILVTKKKPVKQEPPKNEI